MQEKSDSQKYLSNILKKTGHAATKMGTDNPEKLVGASVDGVGIANKSAPQMVPTSMANSSYLRIFQNPQVQQLIADEVRVISVLVDEEIDECVDGKINACSSTM